MSCGSQTSEVISYVAHTLSKFGHPWFRAMKTEKTTYDGRYVTSLLEVKKSSTGKKALGKL
jgi:hypothetical protein